MPCQSEEFGGWIIEDDLAFSRQASIRFGNFRFSFGTRAFITCIVYCRDLVEISFADLDLFVAKGNRGNWARCDFAPVRLVFGAIDVITNNIWFQIWRPEQTHN